MVERQPSSLLSLSCKPASVLKLCRLLCKANQALLPLLQLPSQRLLSRPAHQVSSTCVASPACLAQCHANLIDICVCFWVLSSGTNCITVEAWSINRLAWIGVVNTCTTNLHCGHCCIRARLPAEDNLTSAWHCNVKQPRSSLSCTDG